MAQSVTIPGQTSGLAKLASLAVNRRSRSSAVMVGLALSMGISSFPVNYSDTVATAAESATGNLTIRTVDRAVTLESTNDGYVRQLRGDVALMRSQHGQQSSLLLAQIESGRGYAPVANRGGETNNLQFGSETSVQIFVPAPKTNRFKAVATAPFANGNEADGPFGNPADKLPSTRTGETSISFLWPAAGKLTSKFGRRWGRMHKGIDIAGPVGTPIHAAADGTVVVAGWSSGGYGNLVEIRHADGTTTRYGHNSRLSVSAGQTVRQGQQVAEMGSTGHSTGSHLHFEIRPGGTNAVNPMAYLPSNV